MLTRYRYLSKITDFIESNINEELNLEEVARAGAVSLMQLYRDFYVHTGHSIKEYIRKRRLSNACAMIKHTDISLVEIALANGYQTQQSFHKHFKNVLGITPLEYKTGDVYFSFYPYRPEKINAPVKVATETIPLTISCKYYSSQQRGIENKAICELLDIMKKNHLCGEKIRLFGRDCKQKGGRFCYELMVAPSGQIDDWLNVLRKSNFHEVAFTNQAIGFYASCMVENNEQEIMDGWFFLSNSWLNCSMFALEDRDYFEEYCFKGQVANRLKLFLPVKKKPNYRMIALEDTPSMTFLIRKETGPDAEIVASQWIMNFLNEHYPHLINENAAFYVSCYDDTYECGIKLDQAVNILECCGAEVLQYPEGTYAKIDDDCCGDIRIHMTELNHWLGQNGFLQENQKGFALFEARDGTFEASTIKMTVYAPAKC